MEKYITENGITYELKGEQYYPMFAAPKQYPIGKYGMMYLSYIKTYCRGTYAELLMSGRLNSHLAEIDIEAHRMIDSLIVELVREAGIDEQMKAVDPIRWVREMNVCKATAEEFVMKRLMDL